MRSAILKYFDMMNRYFEHFIALLVLLGVFYFLIHLIIYIGRFLWNGVS